MRELQQHQHIIASAEHKYTSALLFFTHARTSLFSALHNQAETQVNGMKRKAKHASEQYKTMKCRRASLRACFLLIILDLAQVGIGRHFMDLLGGHVAEDVEA
jgi:hypothetical protein